MPKLEFVRLTEDDHCHINILKRRANQEDIAKQIGVAHSSFSNALRGRQGIPKQALERLRSLRLEELPKTRNTRYS